MTAANTHPFALDARKTKLAEALSMGIDAAYISSFVDRFYDRIRSDDLLGPIFAEHIADWPSHLEQMKRFWRSVLHNSGEFNGSPMRKHVAIDGLEEHHFERWLTLFRDTLRDGEVNADATDQVAAKAKTIAESLLTGIKLQRHGLLGSRIETKLPDV